jgi:hypothetical protein
MSHLGASTGAQTTQSQHDQRPPDRNLWLPPVLCSTRNRRGASRRPLSEERILRHTPSNYDIGEDGQWRTVRARVLKVFPEEPEIVTLTDGQTAAVLDVCTHARDRFLIYGLRTTGLRINEQLGLRRSDMHLLPSSRHLGCRFDGPRIHDDDLLRRHPGTTPSRR